MARTVSDSLGDMEVPDGALYGASTQRAVENFPISDETLPPLLVYALAIIKKHCSSVNEECGVLDTEVASRIREAADAVSSGEHNDQFVVDVFQTGSGTSTNMNMNEVLATLAGEGVHPNDHVNLSQSSNDVFPTALHVSAALSVSNALIPALQHLQSVLEDKSEEFASVIKTGRTHLQDAVPVSLGQEFSGYAAQVYKSIERIEASLEGVFELPLGGTAVGTGLNAPEGFGAKVAAKLNDELGLAFREADNHFEAQAARDSIVFLSAALRSTALSLSKVANDIRFLGSGPNAGLGELQLPALQPGSSIMPGKVNPVLCESVLQVACQVVGNDAAIAHGSTLSSFELNVAMPMMAKNILESIHILSSVSTLFADRCVSGLQANIEQLREFVENNPMLITRLAEKIGYDHAAKIAKMSYGSEKSLQEIVTEETDLSEKEIGVLLDASRMI